MSRIPTLPDLGDVNGKRVLVRTDFNVPIDNGFITDDFRIRARCPPSNGSPRGATVVCASHLGQPKRLSNPKYSMDPVRKRSKSWRPAQD
jgi:phosphoglycerate kinase